MSAPLKSTNLTTLYARKPYRCSHNFPAAAPTAASVFPVKPILPLQRSSATWWCRALSCASRAHRGIAYFRDQKSDPYTFDSVRRRQGGHRGHEPEMPATLNGGADHLYYECDASRPGNHRERKQGNQDKLLTLPTILTIGRVAAVPLLVSTFYVESWWGPSATTLIFIAAAITDWLDGYLARKMNLRTQFGAFLDPVADKLMVAATLILLCTKPFEAGIFGQASWIVTLPAIAIIGREITMSAVREWAASQDRKLLEAVAVNNLGKWKTATQMTALTILLAVRDSSVVGSEPLTSSGVVLLYISSWLAIWSLVVYMKKIRKVLLR